MSEENKYTFENPEYRDTYRHTAVSYTHLESEGMGAMRFSELHCREVINLCDGARLGEVCDLEMCIRDRRQPADDLELLVGKKYWPFPTYSDILFYV